MVTLWLYMSILSNAQVRKYARSIHFVTVHCIISFQSLEEWYVINNGAIKVNFWHLTTNMVNSIEQNFCEKIIILSDFICMFKLSFFFLAHPVYLRDIISENIVENIMLLFASRCPLWPSKLIFLKIFISFYCVIAWKREVNCPWRQHLWNLFNKLILILQSLNYRVPSTSNPPGIIPNHLYTRRAISQSLRCVIFC